MKEARLPWLEGLDAAANLTAYAVASRYPGLDGELTEAEYQQAITIAKQVVDWAEHTIRRLPRRE